jgi:uncharacterized protein YukE
LDELAKLWVSPAIPVGEITGWFAEELPREFRMPSETAIAEAATAISELQNTYWASKWFESAAAINESIVKPASQMSAAIPQMLQRCRELSGRFSGGSPGTPDAEFFSYYSALAAQMEHLKQALDSVVQIDHPAESAIDTTKVISAESLIIPISEIYFQAMKSSNNKRIGYSRGGPAQRFIDKALLRITGLGFGMKGKKRTKLQESVKKRMERHFSPNYR